MNPYEIIKKVVVTEKSTGLRETQNKYIFAVNKESTKHQIKWAIEQLFKVKVDSVHTAIFFGKKRRMGMNEGYRPDWKKAIVTLSKGQQINLEEKI